jgi:hypothetical protein
LVHARRGVVLLALAALSMVAGRFGLPVCGMWDGPL